MLSPLQQELYDLMKAQVLETDLIKFVDGVDEDNVEYFLEGVKEDVSRMNAAELRQNIKIWKDGAF